MNRRKHKNSKNPSRKRAAADSPSESNNTIKKSPRSLRLLAFLGAVVFLVTIVLFIAMGLWPFSGDISNKEIGRDLGIENVELVHNNRDPSCYTQGLVIHGGFMYESCGMYGKSRLRKLEIDSGAVLKEVMAPKHVFAEGIEVMDDSSRILMLTWREKLLLEYDLHTLELSEMYSFRTTTGQGWGISSNGDVVVVTDGSSFLHFWDPKDMRELQKKEVTTNDGTPLTFLNEIEFVSEHELLANIWFKEIVARIDIRTGKVLGFHRFDSVLKRLGDNSGDPEVMNGIAFENTTKTIYFTGKRWKSLFKAKL